jgi:hypothetical protein
MNPLQPKVVSRQCWDGSVYLFQIEKPQSLNGVGECAFGAPEDHHANQEDGQADPESDSELPTLYDTSAEEGEAETLDDRDHRIKHDEPAPILRDARERIKHATGIHPQLHAEANKQREVFVSRGVGRNEATHADSEQCHLKQQQGNKNDGKLRMNRRAFDHDKRPNDEKQTQLNAKRHQVSDGVGNGNGQPGEVNFAENRGVGGKSAGAAPQATGEVSPSHQSGHIE